MVSASLSTAVALLFVWLGMVVAISFIEAPLKFRAPGITIPLGLGIGRLVFRALNSVEVVIAVALAITAAVGGDWPTSTLVAFLVATAALLVQVVAIRPVLARRSDAVLADPENVPEQRSHAHLWYVAFDLIKVAALITAGVSLLS
ncbi:hypothetical protein [Gordonia sp. VNK21]|uniref:hypothetical protein n=1 Tax=Gordonia sp. VNK21 TaxID=3382483 RepID=UPI0038D38738